VKYAVESTGVIDRLLEPYNFLSITAATILIPHGLLQGLLVLVSIRGWKYQYQSKSWAWNKCQQFKIVQREHILKAERRQYAKLVNQFGKRFWIGFKWDEVLSVDGFICS
jgi:hypothetical protein